MSLLLQANVAAEIAELSHLSVNDLQEQWTRVLGGPPPKNARREYLLRAVVHELQSRAHGGLSKSLRRALTKIAEIKLAPSVTTGGRTRSLKPGARLYREWKGAVHEIDVVADGYHYRGATFKSLSVIARKITGTRWSGPAFFGLKIKGQRESNARP